MISTNHVGILVDQSDRKTKALVELRKYFKLDISVERDYKHWVDLLAFHKPDKYYFPSSRNAERWAIFTGSLAIYGIPHKTYEDGVTMEVSAALDVVNYMHDMGKSDEEHGKATYAITLLLELLQVN